MSSRDEVLRMAGLLEATFRVAKIPIREFEHRIGMGSGTLSRIFRGEIDLKFRHVFDVLDGLGVAHEEFFRLAYKDRGSRGEVLAQEVMKLLGDQIPARRTAQPQDDQPAAPITEEEIDRRIEKAFRDHGILLDLQAKPPEKRPGAGKGRKPGKRTPPG
jgi:transcriptional regulator with XRE-family HTH domain